MKKQTEKIYKIATILFLVLSIGIVLFPILPDPKTEDVQFVRNRNQLTTTHGSAGQRDYLFEEETNVVYSGTLWTNTTTNNSWSTIGTYSWNLPSTNTTGSITNSNVHSTTWQNIPKYCMTPRGQRVENEDFVLAYEQRKDVSSMCNVERRICINGILEWSYAQSSCKENITYQYRKAEIINYNEPIVNPLVQPEKPSNAGGSFWTDGKITTPQTPTTMRGNTNNTNIGTSTSTQQTITYKQNCTSPRWTTVNHWQFIKAYKSNIGLLDVPCETQLRLCVNGILKGTFENKTCTFKNMTYNDYIAWNKDFTKPTPQDIQSTLTEQENTKNYGIWDRIKGVFK